MKGAIETIGVIASIAGILIGVAAAIAGLSLIVASPFIVVSYYADKATCQSFGRQSHREVKFIRYPFWGWDCLTPTSDGKYVSTRMLRGQE